jgi:C-terminal processing protease CtpA/Prc
LGWAALRLNFKKEKKLITEVKTVKSISHWFVLAVLVAYWTISCLGEGSASVQEQMSSVRRQQALSILHDASEAVHQHYYDSTLHGSDFNMRVQQADKRIREVKTFSEALGVVAWALDTLNDSHTFLIPPPRPYDVQNGWQMGFIGEDCYITAVQPGSDAAAKGVKPGDQVLMIDGFRPTRETLWKIRYAFNVLAPRSGMHLVLASPKGQPREILVMASVRALKDVYNAQDIWDLVRWENLNREQRLRWVELGNILIVKMPQFDLEDEKVDHLIRKARDHESLILDLRGNPGGSERTLTNLLGGLFDHDVKVADRVGRKHLKPVMAKSHGEHAFSGKLVVLVDSASASAAELLARTAQLQKRGVVMGDRSSGSVMEAKIFPYSGDFGGLVYSFEVTVSDLVMGDGKSLEHAGVIPDRVIVPLRQDLAANRDPVLAAAVESVGGNLSAEKAGELFPIIWHQLQ